MTSPKIVIYTPYSSDTPGAAGMRVRSIQEALEKKHCTVAVLTPRDGKNSVLFRRILEENPSAVIATSPPLPPLSWVWLASKVCQSIFVLDAKDDGRAIALLSKNNLTWKEYLFLRLRAFVYRNADAIWFLTSSDESEAAKHYHLSKERMTIAPNGCDERIKFDAVLRKKIRKEWKISPRETVLLYAGSLGDEDVEGFLDAAREVSAKVHLVFVATVDQTPEDAARKEALLTRLSQQKQPHQYYENIPPHKLSAIFSGADVGIVPWQDALPTSIPVKTFDYAGTGLPIIAKCPARGELHALLQQNPDWGSTLSDWSEFPHVLSRTLQRFSPTSYPSAKRAQKAKRIHSEWGREARVQKAITTLLERIQTPKMS